MGYHPSAKRSDKGLQSGGAVERLGVQFKASFDVCCWYCDGQHRASEHLRMRPVSDGRDER